LIVTLTETFQIYVMKLKIRMLEASSTARLPDCIL